jgi:hypothetical protein
MADERSSHEHAKGSAEGNSDANEADGTQHSSVLPADTFDQQAAQRRNEIVSPMVSATHVAPAVAASSSASLSATTAAAAAMPLSVAQRCAQDSLSVVFSFCHGISHAAAAAQTCRSWYATATLRQSSCRAKVSLDRAGFLQQQQMLQSPLRVHITALELGNVNDEILFQLPARCPQLEELKVCLDDAWVIPLTSSDAGAASFNAHVWPSSLRSLDLGLGFAENVGLQPFIDSLPRSAAGLHSLKLSSLTCSDDYAPLLQLPHLTRLILESGLSHLQMAVVRQLRSLTELKSTEGDEFEMLELLADGPHQLQRLEKINIRGTLNIELMQPLLTLPNLTELVPWGMFPDCFSLLRSFSKLRKLEIQDPGKGDEIDEAAVSALLSSLREMSHLTFFLINGMCMVSIQQSTLVEGLGAAVPQLRELTLSCFRALPSWRPLRTCTQLRSLRLICCDREDDQPPANDVLELLSSLRHIERVEFDGCDLLLTDAQRAQLTPPSALVPSLKQFNFE